VVRKTKRRTWQQIEEALERDYFLTAEMARDFGVVDRRQSVR
jgi:ATP-dependent protease ClpP protease subunit